MIKKILLIFCLVLFLAFAAAVIFTRIDSVTVIGNEKYTAEEIENLIFKDRLSRNSAYQLVRGFFHKKETIPFVEDYKINFLSPDSVEVIIYEKSITGYVTYMSSYMYFDKDGIVVDSSNVKIDGIPEITGLKFGSIVLYRYLPVEDEKVFEDILNLTQTLTVHGIKANEIHYDASRNATLHIGGLTVELGSDENMNGKVAELADMLPQIEHKMSSEGIKEGTLYLDSYDETNTNQIYTFKAK